MKARPPIPRECDYEHTPGRFCVKCGQREPSDPNSPLGRASGKPGRNKNRRAGRKYPKLRRRLLKAKVRRLLPGMRVRGERGQMYIVDIHGALRRVSAWEQGGGQRGDIGPVLLPEPPLPRYTEAKEADNAKLEATDEAPETMDRDSRDTD
jgi:hypothetical protein